MKHNDTAAIIVYALVGFLILLGVVSWFGTTVGQFPLNGR